MLASQYVLALLKFFSQITQHGLIWVIGDESLNVTFETQNTCSWSDSNCVLIVHCLFTYLSDTDCMRSLNLLFLQSMRWV